MVLSVRNLSLHPMLLFQSNPWLRWFGLWSLLILMVGCQSDVEYPDRATLMRQALDRKLQSYRRVRTESCQRDILRTAETVADSIMIVRAKQRRDTTQRPPRPNRPEKPEILRPSDTVAIRPLFPDTLEME